MKVSDLAKRAGVGAHTIRYYARAGLIAPRRNPTNNYKQFSEQDAARLRFIKATQALGFTLGEVQALLNRIDDGECPCSTIHEHLADKILQVSEELANLEGRLHHMRSVYERWSIPGNGARDVGELCRELESQAASIQSPEPANREARPARVAKGKTMSRAGSQPNCEERRRRSSIPHGALPAVDLLLSEWRNKVTVTPVDK